MPDTYAQFSFAHRARLCVSPLTYKRRPYFIPDRYSLYWSISLCRSR